MRSVEEDFPKTESTLKSGWEVVEFFEKCNRISYVPRGEGHPIGVLGVFFGGNHGNRGFIFVQDEASMGCAIAGKKLEDSEFLNFVKKRNGEEVDKKNKWRSGEYVVEFGAVSKPKVLNALMKLVDEFLEEKGVDPVPQDVVKHICEKLNVIYVDVSDDVSCTGESKGVGTEKVLRVRSASEGGDARSRVLARRSSESDLHLPK